MSPPAAPQEPLSVEEYLKAYLVVDQRELRVERHWRDESGRWWRAEAVGTEGIVPIPCPETELTLPRIYEGL